MWFEVGGYRLKFGLEEFALISGLRCIGDSNKFSYKLDSNRLLDKYFKGLNQVSKQTLSDFFKSRRWDCDEDGFKIAFLHFLHNFLLASPMTVRVPFLDFDIVESDRRDDYPWGLDVFNCTFVCLSTKAVRDVDSLRDEKNGDKCYYYRLIGFPYAFLCWFYECCPSITNTYVQDINSSAIPRILKWKPPFNPKYVHVDRDLFVETKTDEVIFRSVFPTAAERSALFLGNFFKKNKGKAKVSDDEQCSDNEGFEEGYCAAYDISKHTDSTQSAFTDATVTEKFEVLFAGQKKLEGELADIKRLVTSKFSELFAVVNSLKIAPHDRGTNNQDDNVGATSKDRVSKSSSKSQDENEDDVESSEAVKESHDSGEDSKVEDTESDDIFIVKLKKKTKNPSENTETSHDGEEESIEDISVKGDVNVEDEEIDNEVLSEVDKVSADCEATNKVDKVSVDAVTNDKVEKGSVDAEINEKVEKGSVDAEINEKVEIFPVHVKSNEKVFLDADIIESEHKDEDVGEETTDVVQPSEYKDDSELKDQSNIADIQAAPTSGSALEHDTVEQSLKDIPSREVQSQKTGFFDSPTFDPTDEMLEETEQSAIRISAALKAKNADYVTAAFGAVAGNQITIVRFCPFEAGSIFVDIKKQQDFLLWLLKGIDKRKKSKIYNDKEALLNPSFRFGSISIDEKVWLHTLYTRGKALSSTHVDVILYYLRKKVKIGKAFQKSCTSTDNFFDRRIQALYKLYEPTKDSSVISSKHPVCDYIIGGIMDCNICWYDADDVLFPINLENEWHWILGRLNFKDICIYVYNSLRSAKHDNAALEVLKCYSELLPLFFEMIHLYELHKDIDVNTGPYKGKKGTDPFDVKIVENLPIQDDNDCGIHMVCAAEFFIDGKEMGPDFVAKEHRARYASSLYAYGNWKENSNFVSEDECPVKYKRHIKN
ncbi:uncharacterized protein LOC126681420 isoform X2 [Mercurialis annua]|uniref:uncharacterized protein LOC126681420 isoform X2 n=1 Tax=Mercurialis annua TaxID=3986 RepID=UPI00215DF462|nr:uncharacterized protein LOC126681420 isoform X2 [Mercurialis annua]